MDSLSIVVRISTSPYLLLGTIAFLTLIFHVLLVWVWSLSDIGWKKVDYLWLAAAAVGVLAASAQGGHIIAAGRLNLQESWAASAYITNNKSLG